MAADKTEKDREARLKAALRDNLKRRKQAARKTNDDKLARRGDDKQS
jgi:hypothetical protein